MVSRIKQLLDWQQLSPTQFADRIGIGRPVISHILSERNKPSLDVVQHILTAFPEVAADWLVKGEGTMLAASVPAMPVAPVVPATASKVAAPVAAPAAPIAAAPLVAAAPPPTEPVRPAVAVIAAPRPAISRFSVSKPAVASQATPEPAVPEPAPAAPVGLPSAVTTPASLPSPNQAPMSEAAAGSITPGATPGPAASAVVAPALADMFGEPGKAIRRIVIFYRDGSFADYQPEG